MLFPSVQVLPGAGAAPRLDAHVVFRSHSPDRDRHALPAARPKGDVPHLSIIVLTCLFGSAPSLLPSFLPAVLSCGFRAELQRFILSLVELWLEPFDQPENKNGSNLHKLQSPDIICLKHAGTFGAVTLNSLKIEH